MSRVGKDCCEEERKASLRRRRPRTKVQRERWAARIRLKYGLTPDQIAQKWGEQGGLCPICWQDLAEKLWVIDHKHGVPKGPAAFRGILCAWCNHQIVSRAERGGKVRAAHALVYLGWATLEDIPPVGCLVTVAL